jgi:hypothetical protein
MKLNRSLYSRLAMQLATAGLASACWLQPSLAATAAEGATIDAEAAAHENWHSFMSHNTSSEAGCFEATYPSFVWEKTECQTIAQPRVHPIRRNPSTGAAQVTGNGNDYAARAAGLISQTLGTFPKVTGVTSEKDVGVAAFGGGGILGANEYTLQINTNFTGTTAACAGHSGCTVWQQFIYATDYVRNGQGAVFIQYWLIGWGNTRCPSGWMSAGGGDCFRNSAITAAPDVAITSASLAKLTLSGAAVAGGNDTVVFNNGTKAYSLTAKDSVVDISAVWRESEFNIIGDAGGARATFNTGSSVTVKVALTDGSTAAPTCVANDGTTGETNNLNLGACTTAGGTTPSIQFTESN